MILNPLNRSTEFDDESRRDEPHKLAVKGACVMLGRPTTDLGICAALESTHHGSC